MVPAERNHFVVGSFLGTVIHIMVLINLLCLLGMLIHYSFQLSAPVKLFQVTVNGFVITEPRLLVSVSDMKTYDIN